MLRAFAVSLRVGAPRYSVAGRRLRLPALVLPAAMLLGVFLAPGAAFAHPLIDDARSAYESGQYDRALASLQTAEEGEGLTREDLSDLYLLRANIHRRQQNMQLAQVDLQRLASLDPERQLGRRVHPSLRRLFSEATERVTRPVRVEAAAERLGSSVTVTATVSDDIAALVQGFRIHARAAGGEWRTSQRARLSLTVESHLAAEFWAEAVGPGGAPVATSGSEDSPLNLAAVSTTVENVTPDPEGPQEGGNGNQAIGTGEPGVQQGGDEGIPAWPFVVGGVALLAIAGVILGVYFGTQPGDDTQLGAPMVGALVASPQPLLTFD
ncbi:MAG: tetratricopeptide repeat protein [Sandaracinaceae bacterium]